MRSVAATNRSSFGLIEPRVAVSAEDVRPFPCAAGALIRHLRETKGDDYTVTTSAVGPACSPNGTSG